MKNNNYRRIWCYSFKASSLYRIIFVNLDLDPNSTIIEFYYYYYFFWFRFLLDYLIIVILKNKKNDEEQEDHDHGFTAYQFLVLVLVFSLLWYEHRSWLFYLFKKLSFYAMSDIHVMF